MHHQEPLLIYFFNEFAINQPVFQDLAAAAMKLRGLELGLNQMRLSASKPDVSSLQSNGSGGE